MYDNLERYPGILISRFDSRLAFYNCSHFKEQIYAKEVDEPHPGDIFDVLIISSL